MTDRELLEAAAKAAGYILGGHTQADWKVCVGGKEWNPLTDDGDALRLAVKLNMQISYEPEPDGPVVLVIFAHLPTLVSVSEDLNRDPYAATRRAIVRAAAAIAGENPRA